MNKDLGASSFYIIKQAALFGAAVPLVFLLINGITKICSGHRLEDMIPFGMYLGTGLLFGFFLQKKRVEKQNILTSISIPIIFGVATLLSFLFVSILKGDCTCFSTCVFLFWDRFMTTILLSIFLIIGLCLENFDLNR